MTMRPEPAQDDVLPMRTVSAITGVSPVTLRSREWRYGSVTAERTHKGRRLCTRKDLVLVNRIVRQLDRGISTGQASHSPGTGFVEPAENAQQQSGHWLACQDRAIDTVVRSSENLPGTLYDKVLALYPIDVGTEHLPTQVPVIRCIEGKNNSTLRACYKSAHSRQEYPVRPPHDPDGNYTVLNGIY